MYEAKEGWAVILAITTPHLKKWYNFEKKIEFSQKIWPKIALYVKKYNNLWIDIQLKGCLVKSDFTQDILYHM